MIANTTVAVHGWDVGGSVLVDPLWLAAHLTDPQLQVVEVDVSSAAYDDWHIDGAVLWSVYGDLKDGNYDLVGTADLQMLIERSGIRAESTVVFYGYAAAMGFWIMKLFGHQDVRILDCSRDTWRAEGNPWTATATEPKNTSYHLADQGTSIRAGRDAVQNAIGRATTTLLDVRSEAEYKGERFWPSGGMEPNGRPGHVPTAVHVPIDALYDERGAFRDAGALRRVFSSKDFGSEDELITYCTIGGRAATAWFVLTYPLGHKYVRVYDGSWAEWGRLADTPVEQT
jgi:thiosulfate/3-mercaptopyruvate sulfurtransferase